nr:DUF3515 family protein [Micromonospora sp. DSM 115978]
MQPRPALPSHPSRPSRPPRAIAAFGVLGLIVVVGTAGLLTGCSDDGAVMVSDAPTPVGAEAASCEALIADLPVSLGDDLDRRTVEPPVPTAAAWGSAPAVLTCGAEGAAAGYRPDSMLSVVNDVGWFTEQLDGTVRFSTPTRRPQVVLTLPSDIAAFGPLTALSAAVLEHTTSTTP